MTFKIDKTYENQIVILRLSGGIRLDGLQELKRQIEGVTEKIVLDLKEVTLIEVEVVRFLGLCASRGTELRNCAPYIREWILQEQNRGPNE
jgi:anti-anti-sigma regulatory factor